MRDDEPPFLESTVTFQIEPNAMRRDALADHPSDRPTASSQRSMPPRGEQQLALPDARGLNSPQVKTLSIL